MVLLSRFRCVLALCECGITHKKVEQYGYSVDTLAQSVDFCGIPRCHICSCQEAGILASVSGTLEMEHALTSFKIMVLTSTVSDQRSFTFHTFLFALQLFLFAWFIISVSSSGKMHLL